MRFTDEIKQMSLERGKKKERKKKILRRVKIIHRYEPADATLKQNKKGTLNEFVFGVKFTVR